MSSAQEFARERLNQVWWVLSDFDIRTDGYEPKALVSFVDIDPVDVIPNRTPELLS